MDAPLGNTDMVSSLHEYENKKIKNTVINAIDVSKIKPSLDKGKKVILLGIAIQFAQPEGYRVFPDRPTTNEFYDNVKLEGALSLVHEAWAHGLQYLNKDGKKTNALEDHERLFGTKSSTSPDIETIIKKNNPYKNTPYAKMAQEILKFQKRPDYEGSINKN